MLSHTSQMILNNLKQVVENATCWVIPKNGGFYPTCFKMSSKGDVAISGDLMVILW